MGIRATMIGMGLLLVLGCAADVKLRNPQAGQAAVQHGLIGIAAPIPLNTPDPRFADYFQQIKKRLEASWVYPREAARRGQSGQLVAKILVRKDGSVPLVELVHSSGVEILDRYALNAVRFASPFPAIPDRLSLDKIPITITFTYALPRHPDPQPDGEGSSDALP